MKKCTWTRSGITAAPRSLPKDKYRRRSFITDIQYRTQPHRFILWDCVLFQVFGCTILQSSLIGRWQIRQRAAAGYCLCIPQESQLPLHLQQLTDFSPASHLLLRFRCELPQFPHEPPQLPPHEQLPFFEAVRQASTMRTATTAIIK